MKRTLEELLEELKDKGVSEKTLNAMRIIKREYFVINKEEAYLNEALPFLNQTTSQPLVIANIIDELDLTEEDVVIEAGTGSGYQTCLLALLSKKVHSFEIDKQIFEKGKENILNFIKQHPHLKMKITLYRKDIFNADDILINILKEEGKIDKVVFSFSIKEIPKFFLKEINNPITIIAPMEENQPNKNQKYQKLKKIIKQNNKIITKDLGYVSFVKERRENK